MATIVKSSSGIVFAAISVAIASNVAWAQPSPPDNDRHIAANLVAETRSLVPGQPLHLALRLQIQPGWHTYWSNPGDSGLPTTIDWTLPREFKAGPIMWPTPERFAYGPVVDYGYENETLLPVTIDVPANLAPGGDIVLAAHASWLVCSDTCIPEDAELKISVPVAAQAEPDPYWAARFASNRAHLPLPNPFPTSAAAASGTIVLHVAAGDASRLRDLTFFPADADVIDGDATQTVTIGPEGLTLVLSRDGTKPAPAVLRGLLVFHDSAAQAEAEPEAIAVSTPLDPPTANASGGIAFIWAAVLAFLGGILLNLMPCVLHGFPIKAAKLRGPRPLSRRSIAAGAPAAISRSYSSKQPAALASERAW